MARRSQRRTDGLRRLPLVREIAVVLLIKIAFIAGIKWCCFSNAPASGPRQVSAALLGSPGGPDSAQGLAWGSTDRP